MHITKLTQKIESWASETAFIYKFASGYYRDVVEKEIVLANIGGHDHILCVGGGICPFTAILFHQTTGAKVTVIDNDSCCVPKAKRVIERLGISDAVRVLCQDGSNQALAFADYTVVHFALQVCPMEGVFSNIENRVDPGTKLLIRQPKRKLRKLYDKLPSALLRRCPLTMHKKARNIGSTLLYVKPTYAA
ncbi:MAG: hypothetical protein FWE06_01245 [Oscillospiraceae bacterium]|nr:hypothetical protein [Oscillospiraceae bacterium]